jgi:hypothetical protein
MDDLIKRLRRLDPVPEQLAPVPLDEMMRLLDQQPDRRAADPVTRGARDDRSRRRPSIGALATIASLIVALIIGGGALVLLGNDKRAVPSSAHTVTPGRQELISMLGVLRRPQTKADVDRWLLNQIEQRDTRAQLLGTPDVPLMRLVITSWGEKLYLVPMKPPTVSALRAAWEKISQLNPQSIPLRKFIAAHDIERLSLSTSNAGGGGDATAANIQDAGSDAFAGAGVAGLRPSQGGYQYLIRVVPDHVTKVVFVVRSHLGRVEPGIPANAPPAVVTARVHDNIAAARIIRKGPGGSFEATWYGNQDQVLKRSFWP